MKIFIIALIAFVGLSTTGLADTYTGTVFEVKHFHNGGVAVDLDGIYPHQKMSLYVPPADVALVGALSHAASLVVTPCSSDSILMLFACCLQICVQ